MKTKTRSKLLSANLANLFKEINSTFGHAKELVLEVYNLAIQEKYTPQEAKQLLLDNIIVFKKTVYSDSDGCLVNRIEDDAS